MKTIPGFLLLLPVALFLAHTEFTTAKSKIVEDSVHQKMCKQRLLTLQSNSFLYPQSPQQTLIQFLSQPSCVMRPGPELSILICVNSFSWDLFVLFLPTAFSISIVSMIFMSPYFFIALFFPAAHCDKNRGIHLFFSCL